MENSERVSFSNETIGLVAVLTGMFTLTTPFFLSILPYVCSVVCGLGFLVVIVFLLKILVCDIFEIKTILRQHKQD